MFQLRYLSSFFLLQLVRVSKLHLWPKYLYINITLYISNKLIKQLQQPGKQPLTAPMQEDQEELYLSLKSQNRGPKTYVKGATLLSEDGLEYKEQPNTADSRDPPPADPPVDKAPPKKTTPPPEPVARSTPSVVKSLIKNDKFDPFDPFAPTPLTSALRAPSEQTTNFSSVSAKSSSNNNNGASNSHGSEQLQNKSKKRGIVEKPTLIPIKDTPVDPVPEPVQDNARCERATQQQFEYFQTYISQKEKERRFQQDEQREIDRFLHHKILLAGSEPTLNVVFEKPEETDEIKERSIFHSPPSPRQQRRTIKIRVKRKSDVETSGREERDEVKKVKVLNDFKTISKPA